MAALSSGQFLWAGVFFAILLTGFLTACAIVAWTEDDEAPDDGSRGDCYLAQELRRHALGPSPDHTESIGHHGKGDTL